MFNNYISGGPLYSWNGIIPERIYQQQWLHPGERKWYGNSILGLFGTASQVQTNTGKDGTVLALNYKLMNYWRVKQ